MIVHSSKPLTMAEVKDYLSDGEEHKATQEYIKTFCKLSSSEAKKIVEGITALNNPKLNEETIVKIVDFHPADIEELSKIAFNANLNEEEANAILNFFKGR